MQIDFSNARFRRRAFSEKPMSFVDQEPKIMLAAIIDLVAIETGNRDARGYWQQKQLENLLRHAGQRSAFWRKRIGSKNINGIKLSDFPILARSDLTKQVETEGSLLPPSGTNRVKKHASSGSSGKPARFFVSEMNEHYTHARSIAQYFLEGRDLTLNRTRFKTVYKQMENGFLAKKTSDWLGPLSTVFKNGNNKDISQLRPNRNMLLKELAKDPIGYLVSPWRPLETLFPDGDISFLADNGTKMFIPWSEQVEKNQRDKFVAAGIPVRSNYSSEEVGYIGAECVEYPYTFHVAESNVIIEIDYQNGVLVDGNRLGRVLVTHLHSYATPLVRYDIGDLAMLSQTCPCGHDGPVLSNIYGRHKNLLRRADGSAVPFYVRGANILDITKCDEFRIRQTEPGVIEVEIGGVDHLTADQTDSLKKFLNMIAGEEFEIEINVVRNIDWGLDVKRLGFRSDLI